MNYLCLLLFLFGIFASNPLKRSSLRFGGLEAEDKEKIEQRSNDGQDARTTEESTHPGKAAGSRAHVIGIASLLNAIDKLETLDNEIDHCRSQNQHKDAENSPEGSTEWRSASERSTAQDEQEKGIEHKEEDRQASDAEQETRPFFRREKVGLHLLVHIQSCCFRIHDFFIHSDRKMS